VEQAGRLFFIASSRLVKKSPIANHEKLLFSTTTINLERAQK